VRDSLADFIRSPRSTQSGPLPPGFDLRVLLYKSVAHWAIAHDGSVWLCDSDRLRLVHRAANGDTLRVIETSHRTAQLSERERDHARVEFEKLSARPIPALSKPIVSAIHVRADGYIFVQLHGDADKFTVLDVFDNEGRYLGPLELPLELSPVSLPAIVGDTILATTRGRLDVPQVVRLLIRK